MPTYSSYGPRDSQVLEVGDVGFSKLNQRLRPDQLGPGEIAVSVNGRMDVDGAWQPRRGIDKLGDPLTANTAVLTVPFYCYGSRSISSAERTDTVVTITTTAAHDFNDATIVGIAGLTGSVDPNGNRLITVTGADTFTFTIDGAAGSETYGGTGTAGAPYIEDDVVTGVFGSCVFSDPSDDSAEYIILAADQSALAINLATGDDTEIAYPAGVTLYSECELLQCFGKVILFRDGMTALEWNGTLTGSPAFTLVANGDYAANTYMDASNNTVIADGVATVTATSHGLSAGQRVYVVDNGTTTLTENGDGYEIATVPTSGSFTVKAQVPDASATTVVWTRRVAAGSGYMHMPAPAWGVYHQRRLWVPYSYLSSGSSGTPTITDRNIRDEIVASDIKDSDTYDRLANQYRITAGTADYLVGALPFAEDNLLVFNRNSIHLISGISGSLADTRPQLITSELGCVARKTIVQVGNQVLFLADNGLYGVEFGDLYNLRGAGLPLSAPVDPIIKRINENYASGCMGIYHNNRYYLAFPLDDSAVNNAVLVYNFINGGWESLDTIDQEGWTIQNLLRAGAGDVNKLYAVSSNGGVHVLDAREDDVDRLALFPGVSAATYSIAGDFQTRQYTMGQLDRKTFRDFEIHMESSGTNNSNATISVELENPDYSGELTTVNSLLSDNLAVSEDASLRGRIGNMRGYGLQLGITPTTGRPKIRAIRVAATITNPAQVQAT